MNHSKSNQKDKMTNGQSDKTTKHLYTYINMNMSFVA